LLYTISFSLLPGIPGIPPHKSLQALTPSQAQIEHWEKEVVMELKESFWTAFLELAEGVEAIEKFVRTVQSYDITREARRNVTHIVETSFLSN
jgi:hypothetical protein